MSDHESSLNPYAPPETASEIPKLNEGQLYVDGNRIVVGKSAVLPPLCVVTGKPVEEADRISRQLMWRRAFRMVSQNHVCALEYYVHADRRLRSRVLKLLAIAFATLIAIVLKSWYAPTVSAIWFPTVVPVLTFILIWSRPVDKLKVQHVEGSLVWISGACREFVEHCRQEYGELQNARIALHE